MNLRTTMVVCPLCAGAGCVPCLGAGKVSAWRSGELQEAQRILNLPNTSPALTVVNFSGGTGSSALVWMLVRGEIERPENLLVLNADPGMEDERTYAYVSRLFEECARVGIEARTVAGPNLWEDIVSAAERGVSRLDNPPYFVAKRGTGRRDGQLAQKCTQQYKIAPMDRAIRGWMQERWDIHPQAGRGKGLRAGLVEKWIGMTTDEMHRVTEPKAGYQIFRYPLIRLGLSKPDLTAWYASRGIEMPPRSVCSGCFANSPAHFAKMRAERPGDWAKTLELDRAIRDLGPQIGATEGDLYITRHLLPVEALADLADESPEDPDMGCQTGYCFY